MLVDIAGKRISKEEYLKSKQKKVIEKPKVLCVINSILLKICIDSESETIRVTNVIV